MLPEVRANALQTHTGDLREDNDIKQEFLARYLNVTQCTYSKYEKR